MGAITHPDKEVRQSGLSRVTGNQAKWSDFRVHVPKGHLVHLLCQEKLLALHMWAAKVGEAGPSQGKAHRYH